MACRTGASGNVERLGSQHQGRPAAHGRQSKAARLIGASGFACQETW